MPNWVLSEPDISQQSGSQWEAAISYNDLHERAVELLRQYGDAASFHAASKADEAFARGDSDTQRRWIGVLKLVEQIDRIGETSLVQ